MKKILLLVVLTSIAYTSFAQKEKEDERKGKFRRDNIFLGGGVGLGIGGWNGGFTIGATPQIGYTITNWMDAGISLNVNYYSFRAEVNAGIRQRSFNFGVGPFVRFYPINSIFVQFQPEYNWITHNLFQPSSGFKDKIKVDAPSFLAGIGYARRIVGSVNFYTLLAMDLSSDINSPYRDSYNAAIPILRTGINVYLKPKKK